MHEGILQMQGFETLTSSESFCMLTYMSVQKIRWFLQDHGNELLVVGIMTGISLAIAFAATGDISEAIARSRKR